MSSQGRIAWAATAIAGTVMIAGTAMAASSPTIPIRHEGPIAYATGGIGKDEQMAMHELAKRFALHIAFSERKDGEFLADVPIVITRPNGEPVFKLAKAGPLLDVHLPDGTYRVTARFAGRAQTREVVLDGKEGKTLYFNWKGQAAS